MLAFARYDVHELNQLARAKMRGAGELGVDQKVQTERGERTFAVGDRIVFLRNEKSLGVKNGGLGTVERVNAKRLTVKLDDRHQAAFETKNYNHFDHGYSSTVHKCQGLTVDQAHVLATDRLDRHAAYVAMSRHRENLSVHYGADDFSDWGQLVRSLTKDRPKETTLDYHVDQLLDTFAERRSFWRPENPEARTLTGPGEQRLVQFLESWTSLRSDHERLSRVADRPARQMVEGKLNRLVIGLQHDPELETLLKPLARSLGLGRGAPQDLSSALSRSIAEDRGLER